MRLLRSLGTTRRWVIFAALLIALAVLAGAASVGRAADNGTVSAAITSVLNDDTSTLVLGAPTPGKNIGYTYSFTNTGSNTINHLVFSVYISGSITGTPKVGAVKYFTVSDPTVSCTAGTALSCTQGQLASLATFTMTVIFSTDPNATGGPNGDKIYPFFTGTYSPQSLNQTNNRKQDTKTFSADNSGSIRNYEDPLSSTKSQSLSLPNDPLDVGSGFTANVTMPKGFLNSRNYVGVTLQNLSGDSVTTPTLCGTCIKFKTVVSIPLATHFTNTGPFYDGSSTAAYTWTVFIPGSLLPSGFKPTHLYHVGLDENGQPWEGYLDTCPTDPVTGAFVPLKATPGLCETSVTQKRNTKDVTYTGLGLDNGSNYGG